MENEGIFYPETKKETTVDLSHVRTEFATDDTINQWHRKKLEEAENFDVWFAENKQRIENYRSSIDAAVTRGEIADDDPRTIWKFRKKLIAAQKESVMRLRDFIKEKQQDILAEVAKRLSEYLPDWKPEDVTVEFDCNDAADFCYGNEKVTADLGRLAFNAGEMEAIKQGLVHELVHAWMDEFYKEGSSQKELVLNRIFSEGLAMHIAKEDLKKHYDSKGIDFQEAREEAFALFEKYLTSPEDGDFSKFKEAFDDKGLFYIVGKDMVESVEKKIGHEKFKELLLEAKKNPEVLFEEYKKNEDA